MNKLGLRNAEGNPLGASRIEINLKSPFYYGVMRVKGEFYPHKYPPLISEWLDERIGRVKSRKAKRKMG